MSYGPLQVFASTGVVSGASTLTIVTIPKGYTQYFAEVGTMSTAAAFDVYGSSDGTTFRPLFERVNTATIQYQTFTVASSVGANGGIAPLLVYGVPYVQFRASAVVSGGVTFKFIGTD